MLCRLGFSRVVELLADSVLSGLLARIGQWTYECTQPATRTQLGTGYQILAKSWV